MHAQRVASWIPARVMFMALALLVALALSMGAGYLIRGSSQSGTRVATSTPPAVVVPAQRVPSTPSQDPSERPITHGALP
jgi:hypothetical protein